MGVEEDVWMYRQMHPGISSAELGDYRRDVERYAQENAEKLREIAESMGLRWPWRKEEPPAEVGEVFDITPEVTPDEEAQRQAYLTSIADQRRQLVVAQAQLEAARDVAGGFGADPGDTIFE